MTSEDMRRAMRATWRQPEWALLFEVSDGTGAGRSRTVDAVLMSLWPSKGLEVHGVEIKTSRSDWLRELRDPSKAQAISRHCDRFWLHAAPGVARSDELPMQWGLREWDGHAWTIVSEAGLTGKKHVPKDFLAAILRRTQKEREADAAQEALRLVEDRLKDLDEEVATRVAALTQDAARSQELFRRLSEKTGLQSDQIATDHDLRMAVRIASALMRSGIAGGYSGLAVVREMLAGTVERLDQGMDALGIDRLGGKNGSKPDSGAQA